MTLAPLFFSHFSHVVPNLVLGPTFVHFWVIVGPPRLHFGIILLHFGLIWAPFFCPPQLPFSHHMPSEISEHYFLEHPSGSSNNLRRLLDTADVLEICANRFLEHRTSHTDMITSSKLVHTGDVLEFFDDSFLEHLTSHTDMNTSSKFVHTRYHTLGGGRCLRRKALTIRRPWLAKVPGVFGTYQLLS